LGGTGSHTRGQTAMRVSKVRIRWS
jgi:hypothetical protein